MRNDICLCAFVYESAFVLVHINPLLAIARYTFTQLIELRQCGVNVKYTIFEMAAVENRITVG